MSASRAGRIGARSARSTRRARAGLLGGAVLLAGCVGHQSGVREAHAIVDGRLHLPHVSDEDVSRVVGDLLSKPLTAESAVQIAVLRSPTVHAAFDRIGIARGDLVAALHFPNPTATASLRFVRGSSEPDIDVGGAIDLREFVLMPLRNAVASDALDAASIEAASIAIGVGLRARFAYIDYVASIQSLALERQVVQALDAAAELSRQITDAGNDNVLLALGDRALLEEGRLRLEAAGISATLMRGELSEAMGLGVDDAMGWETSDRLAHPPSDELDLDAAVKTAVEVNLDLVAARARVDSLENDSLLGRLAGVLPEIGVGVVAEHHDDHWGVGPSISVGLPLFNTGQGDVDRAESGAKEQNSLAKRLEIAIRVRVRGLTATIAGTRRQAERYRTTVLPLRQEIIEQTQLLYNGMGTSAFALLDAKREAIIAGQGYVEALRTYWRARTELELLLAGHLRESM